VTLRESLENRSARVGVIGLGYVAKTKPFGFQAFYPGPGLGGHCIPIDPFYLTWVARKHRLSTRLIELAGEINTSMPRYVVSRVVEALNERGKLPALDSQELTESYLQSQDCVLIATDHSHYDWPFIVRHSQLVVDTRNATKDVSTDRQKIKRA
jgi:UDP-N-acetyl-D-glucosamine dehydrogenase